MSWARGRGKLQAMMVWKAFIRICDQQRGPLLGGQIGAKHRSGWRGLGSNMSITSMVLRELTMEIQEEGGWL